MKLGLAGKQYSGFIGLIVLMLIVGTAGYITMGRALLKSEMAADTTNIKYLGAEALALQNDFLLKATKDIQKGKEILKAHHGIIEEFNKSADEIDSMDITAQQRASVDNVRQKMNKYGKFFDQSAKRFEESQKNLDHLRSCS